MKDLILDLLHRGLLSLTSGTTSGTSWSWVSTLNTTELLLADIEDL